MTMYYVPSHLTSVSLHLSTLDRERAWEEDKSNFKFKCPGPLSKVVLHSI